MVGPTLEGELGLDFPMPLIDIDVGFIFEDDRFDAGHPNIKLVYELGRTIVWRFWNLDGFVYTGRLSL